MKTSNQTRRDFLKGLGLFAAAATLPRSAFGRGGAATGKPNIVFILTDDQGWTGLSVQMQG